MMIAKILGWGVAGFLGGYVVGALADGLLLHFFSDNTHDKAQRVATTALLIAGPLGGILSFIGTMVYVPLRS